MQAEGEIFKPLHTSGKKKFFQAAMEGREGWVSNCRHNKSLERVIPFTQSAGLAASSCY